MNRSHLYIFRSAYQPVLLPASVYTKYFCCTFTLTFQLHSPARVQLFNYVISYNPYTSSLNSRICTARALLTPYTTPILSAGIPGNFLFSRSLNVMNLWTSLNNCLNSTYIYISLRSLT